MPVPLVDQHYQLVKKLNASAKQTERKRVVYEIAKEESDHLYCMALSFNQESGKKMMQFIKENPSMYDPAFVARLDYVVSLIDFRDQPKKKAFKATYTIHEEVEQLVLIIPYLLINDPAAYAVKRKKDVLDNKDGEKEAYKAALAAEIQDKIRELDNL